MAIRGQGACPPKTAYEIFGWPDDKKLNSCMTLFTLIQTENNLFQKVIDQYFKGKKCVKTIDLLHE